MLLYNDSVLYLIVILVANRHISVEAGGSESVLVKYFPVKMSLEFILKETFDNEPRLVITTRSSVRNGWDFFESINRS
jgi:hypothetical protein